MRASESESARVSERERVRERERKREGERDRASKRARERGRAISTQAGHAAAPDVGHNEDDAFVGVEDGAQRQHLGHQSLAPARWRAVDQVPPCRPRLQSEQARADVRHACSWVMGRGMHERNGERRGACERWGAAQPCSSAPVLPRHSTCQSYSSTTPASLYLSHTLAGMSCRVTRVDKLSKS